MAGDLYGVLGVDVAATAEELQAAYRKRVRLTHPDTGGDQVAFRAVQKAFEILSDPGLRAGYDAELNGPGVDVGQNRHPGDSQTDGPPPSGGNPAGKGPPAGGDQAGRRPGLVDVEQIPWAQQFLDAPDGGVGGLQILPGRAELVHSYAVIIGGLVWLGIGLVAGGLRYDNEDPLQMLWCFAWWAVVCFVAVRAAQKRGSFLLVAAVALGWPAFQHPGVGSSWLVYAWLVGAVAVPLLAQRRVVERGWSVRQVRKGNVWGEPDWRARRSAEWVTQLAVIPGARILHQAWGYDHAVVLDRRVALVGPPTGPLPDGLPEWLQWRHWSQPIQGDPHGMVTDIGEWLLDGSDGYTVDRRTLRWVAPELA